MMYFFCWVSWPVSKILDYFVAEEQEAGLLKKDLRTMCSLYSENAENNLNSMDISLLYGFLGLKEYKVKNEMIDIDKVYKISNKETWSKELILSI